MKNFLIASLFLSFSLSVFGQANGDYQTRSNGGGNWNGATTWQIRSAGVWVNTATPPTSANGVITILNGDAIIMTVGVTVDQLAINGSLTINSGITLTAGANASIISGGTGTLTVNGTIDNTAGGTVTAPTTASFTSGSLYIHNSANGNGGVVPTATWNTNSTLRIAFNGNTSYTLTSNSWSQSFGNVEVNITTNGNRTIDLAGLLTTINGNFTITQIGSTNGTLVLASSGTNTITVGGNFTMTPARSFNLASTGGTTTTLNIGGNFTQTTGTITSNGTGNINFNGPGTTQVYSRAAGTLSAPINFSISAGALVSTGTTSLWSAASNGSFTLSGELQTGHASGLNGTINNNVGSSRTFNANSTITYNGIVGQAMGNYYPASPASNISVVVNKSGGQLTTSIANTIVTGELRLSLGTLNVLTANHTLTLNGSITATSGFLTLNAAGNLVIGGTGSIAIPFPFSSDQTFAGFTLNRSGADFSMGHNLTLTGDVSLADGTISINAFQLSLNGNYSAAAGLLGGSNSSVLSIGGVGTTATLSFAGGSNILNTLSVNRNGSTVSFGGDYTITNQLDVLDGTLDGGSNIITMRGSTWNVSGGSFNPSTSTVIFDGATTVTATTSFNNITLNPGMSLNFPTDIINVSGDLNFDATATFVHNTGTVQFNSGTGTQVFAGGGQDFYNIAVDNADNSVNLTSGVGLEGVLNVISASDVQSNGNLTLVSTADDPDATGSIAALLGGASVSGTVNSQRLVSAEGRLYRYISTPISGVTVADWQNDFVITGTFTGSSTVDPANGNATDICGTVIRPTAPSLYYYNEATAGTIQNGWIDYPSSGTGEPIVVGRGYAPFIRETCYRDVVITVSGNISNGPLSLPTSFTNTASSDDGWNLIGNPYPSAIRWDANGNGWTKGTDLSTSVDIRDNVSGGFVTLVEGDVIAQGQAFWVKANGADVTLDIDENAKVTPGTGSSFYRIAERKRDLIKINLTKGTITDYAYYRLVEGASSDFERNDFLNQNNDLFDVATLIGSRQVAVNSVGSLTCGSIIPVHVKDMTTGSYSFSIGREGIFAGVDVVLKDKFTGTTTNLSQTENYQFDVTGDAGSKASDRFEIELTTKRVAQASNGVICRKGSATLTASGNYENGSYRWYESSESTTPLSSGASFVTAELSSTKTYYVAAVNALGCEGVRVPVLAEVVQYDDATITVTKKNMLSSNSTIGNQWYFNDVMMEGSTDRTIIATKSGVYRVDITTNGCVNSTSIEHRMIHADDNHPVVAYPNPFTAATGLKVEVLADQIGSVHLINSTGRVIQTLNMSSVIPGVWTSTDDLSSIPPGFYYVRTSSNVAASTIKIVKTQ